MVEHQGPRRRAACQIMVGSQDVTNRLAPFLISVQVIDNIAEYDQCNIELDDRDAQLQIPPDGEKIRVYLGWANEGPRLPDQGRTSGIGGQGPIQMTEFEQALEREYGGPGIELVFSGWVDKCESGFGRKGGGRRLWIEAVSSNNKGPAKETVHQTTGEGNADDSAAGGGTSDAPSATGGTGGGGEGELLFDVMTKAFAKSGVTVKFSPEMMKVKRKAWTVHQSPQDFGSAIAQEVGGVFKIADGVASMVGKDEGVNVDGIPMVTVEAIWGINLIGWRIKPYAGRPQWSGMASRYFDLYAASHEMVKGKIAGNTPFGGANAVAHHLHQVADKAVSGQANEGNSTDSKGRRGTGWVLLNGEPRAKAGGHILINYARPGVDGTYRMIEVEHNYTRGVGFTTRCNVQWPRPSPNGYGWKRSTDVPETPPPETEVPPVEFKPGEFNPPVETLVPGYTAQEIRDMRKWYLDRNMPLPDTLKMTENEKLLWWRWYNERGMKIPDYLKSIEDAPVFVPDIPEL